MLASEIHDDHSSCNHADAYELPWGWHLLIGKQSNKDDGDDSDSTPDGIGDAKRNGLHHSREQQHRGGVSGEYNECGNRPAEPLREFEAGGPKHFGTDRQQ